MYRGATLLNLDGKSRVAIPTKYREVLMHESSGSIVITAHPHGCLLLYPKSAWEPIQNKVMKFSSFDKKSSGLQRLLVGYAEDVNIDASGPSFNFLRTKDIFKHRQNLDVSWPRKSL